MTYLRKIVSKFLLTFCFFVAIIGIVNCSDDAGSTVGSGKDSDPKAEVKWLDLVRPSLGIIGWDQADSTFIFKRYSNSVLVEKWLVSASVKAIGEKAKLESPILNPDNLVAMTADFGFGRSITMPYTVMGVKISAEGSNSSIAQSTDNKYKVKTASYLDNAGLMAKNIHSLQQLKDVLGNKSLEWKLLPTPASELTNLQEAPNAIFNVKVTLN